MGLSQKTFTSNGQGAAFFVQQIPIDNDLILAPMDGFSDYPFRSICRELGSSLSYTEFINAEDIVRESKRIQQKLYFRESERPVVLQLYGEDINTLVQAALRAQELNPDVIDINMGCPTRSVSGRGAGAGLLRTPIKIARLFRKLTSVLKIPVSAKMRIGWDEKCQPYTLIARIVEESGVSLLAVHGRTKKQGYHGKANWDAIAEIKQLLSIPVIGNGDVHTVADIKRMKSYTGCDGVMIGRWAIGNPWIFSRRDREQIPLAEVRAIIHKHLNRNIQFYGETLGMILFRKNAVRYLSPYPLSRTERKRLLRITKPESFHVAIDELFQTLISTTSITEKQPSPP